MLDQLPVELLIGVVARVGEHPEHVLRTCKYVWQLNKDSRALLHWLQQTFGSSGAIFMLSSVRAVVSWQEHAVLTAVQQLMNAGCYIQETTQAGCILYWACKLGHARVLDVLASHLAARGGLAPWVNSVLKTAAAQGNKACVRVLLAKGADPNVDGGRPLKAATEAGCAGCVAALLEAGADVHAGGECALRLCAAQGSAAHLRIMDLLLQRGADVHAKADEALSLAVERGNADAVALLLGHGANASARQVLESAAATGSSRIVRLLLDAGAPPNADGGRPLRAAAEAGAVEVVRCLLVAGAQCGGALGRRSIGQRTAAAVHPAIGRRIGREQGSLARTSHDDGLTWHGVPTAAAGAPGVGRSVSASWTAPSFLLATSPCQPSAQHGAPSTQQQQQQQQHGSVTTAMGLHVDTVQQLSAQVSTVLALTPPQGSGHTPTAMAPAAAAAAAASQSAGEGPASYALPPSPPVVDSDWDNVDGLGSCDTEEDEEQLLSSDSVLDEQQAQEAGAAALCAALCAGEAEVVRVLLEQGGVHVDSRVLACWRQWHCYPAIVALLAAHSLQRRQLPHTATNTTMQSAASSTRCGYAAMQSSAACSSPAASAAGAGLLHACWPPGVQLQLQEVLVAAAKEGSEAAVDLFLRWGAPCSTSGGLPGCSRLVAAPQPQQQQPRQNPLGLFTPASLSAALTAAAAAGRTVIVQQLLGHQPGHPTWLQALLHPAALHAAVVEGHTEVVTRLLAAGIAAPTLAHPPMPCSTATTKAPHHPGNCHTAAPQQCPATQACVSIAGPPHSPPPPLQSEAWGTVVLCAAASCKVGARAAQVLTTLLLRFGFAVCTCDALRLVASGRVPPWKDESVAAILAFTCTAPGAAC